MPKKRTIQKARRDRDLGKSPSTQAGEFVREEIDEVRQGKHGARSTKQVIAIGLSKAHRAGVKLPSPVKGKAWQRIRRHAERDDDRARIETQHEVSARRSRAIIRALRREGHAAASFEALSQQARHQAQRRTAAQRSAIARKAARTRLAHQSPAESRAIARKGAVIRAARRSK